MSNNKINQVDPPAATETTTPGSWYNTLEFQ